MSAVAVDVIGVVGSLLGTWQFGENLIPSVEQHQSTYRIQVGLDGTKDGNGKSLSNSGGSIDQIKTYNNNRELIGSGKGGSISEGGYSDFTAKQTGSQQAITTEFYAGNDAMCIAYISAAMDEGTKWGWVGDWGYTCGMNWFPSGYRMQSSGGNDKVEAPRCTWIDKDHSNDISVGVIAINWADFYHKDGDENPSGDGTSYCGGSLRGWDEEGGKQLLPIEKTKSRARNHRSSQRSDDRLVVSSLDGHNATEVCESGTSWGPDFIATAEGDGGVYCNMETHEVLPICHGSITKDCFALDGGAEPAVVSRLGKRSPRKPTDVIFWK
ncbi:hypothetical protein SLS64_007939 [Diaporthe eres]|uniref:Uncharacterized protein n=1 Tax=Diaporthe eres TaxID=83184 RepID=A0ABR1PFV0_DIAER